MKNPLILCALFVSIACHNINESMLLDLGDTSDDFEDLYAVPRTNQPPPQEEAVKKVIKTGGMDFQSESIEKDYTKIQKLLPSFNAYIENENQSKSLRRIDQRLTIRVPSNNYDSLFSSLLALTFQLDNRYTNIEDVSDRYYDLKTRIKNKKVLELRYLDLLKKTTTIKEILEIEKNLNEVRTDIERLQGQYNYLSKQVDFSTINLSFYEVLPYVNESSNRKSFGSRILHAMNNGWQGFLFFLIRIVSLWPFLILGVAGIYLVRAIKKRRRRKKSE